jgi:hypothetical protein
MAVIQFGFYRKLHNYAAHGGSNMALECSPGAWFYGVVEKPGMIVFYK